MADFGLFPLGPYSFRVSSGKPQTTKTEGLGSKPFLLFPNGFWPPSSSGLGHRPFTAAARVRIPLGVRKELVWQAKNVW